MNQQSLIFETVVRSRKETAISAVQFCIDEYRKDFSSWLKDNWHCYEAFEKRAYKLINLGFKHGSPYEIVENIRWQSKIAEARYLLKMKNEGDPMGPPRVYKINNNYRPDLGRLFEQMNTQYKGFFEKRTRTVTKS